MSPTLMCFHCSYYGEYTHFFLSFGFTQNSMTFFIFFCLVDSIEDFCFVPIYLFISTSASGALLFFSKFVTWWLVSC